MRLFFQKTAQSISKRLLLSLLILGFLHSVIYVFLIPPWWNNDEAGHFEYAWLIANRPNWPQRGDYDNQLRLQMGEASMRFGVENPFNFGPEDLKKDPIEIGVSQVGELPVYHLLASIPLRLMRGTDILAQMYAARLVSTALTVLSLYFAWKTIFELFPRKAWMVTLFLALLPGFINVMAAVNSDVAAGVSAALFLWMSARILKRGFSYSNLAGSIIAIVLCFYSREITRVLLLSAPLVLWGRIRSCRIYLAPLVVGVIAVLVAIPFALTYSDAQFWFVTPASSAPSRVEDARAPFGRAALVTLPVKTDFGQTLPFLQVKSLRNRTLTLGFWMWADQPGTAQSPILNFVIKHYIPITKYSTRFSVGITPHFYTIETTVPENVALIELRIPSGVNSPVYFDGLTLALGKFPASEPQFSNQELSAGTWGNKPFTNLLRNASAEETWLNVNSQVDDSLRFVPFFRRRASLLLATLQDPQAFSWYYTQSVSKLFQTFWGKPAAAQIALPGQFTYQFLQIVTAIAVLGLGLLLPRLKNLSTQHLTFLVAVMLIVWGVTLLRGVAETLIYGTIPWARYALPAYIPLAVFLCAGWQHSLEIIEKYLKYPGFGAALFSAFMAGLALFAMFGVGAYFYPIADSLLQITILLAFITVGFWAISSLKSLAGE